ncbi:MAG: xanthan lyase [Paludibacter sp.]|jgi:hypothetical protein|nr:xanthan lyase [Paludibacter sp.]
MKSSITEFNHKARLRNILLVLLALLATELAAQRTRIPSPEKMLGDSITVIARQYMYCDTIRRVQITPDKATNTVTVTANADFGHIPFRKENVDQIYALLNRHLSAKYPGYRIVASAFQRDIRLLIPNYLREQPDSNRFYKAERLTIPVVAHPDRKYEITEGLQNRNIALWNSHGFHNLAKDTTWGWQRPLLFQTVEDLLTSSFVLPYLAPMLENAGAQVYIPRERDINPHEVIVDNDKNNSSKYKEFNDLHSWKKATPGFAHLKSWYTYPENPFLSGSFAYTLTTTDSYESSHIEWVPDIPVEGMYAVYVSYRSQPNSTTDAHYAVHHSGGISGFKVNQQVNGSTWLYLGHFHFIKGKKNSKVVLTNVSNEEGNIITADAVKFGGGMGSVTGIKPMIYRDNELVPSISGYPRYTEGARYWLQWAGVPDSVYSRTKNTDHYSDDFQSRGHWVNYLRYGLGIPVDLAFAFHTDAGIRTGDSIIGTLGICTVNNSNGDTLYNNGVSRWAGRDLVDLIQTHIVNDIRSTFRSDWTRRGIWNRSYSESRVPEVPTMLLELLSHQNFEDMKYALDPRFRFTVSRSIYKGMLKYLAASHQQSYVVQPLPVRRFSSQFTSRNKVKLKWKATPDSLEPTAQPTQYILYTRKEQKGFDNGRVVMADSIEVSIDNGIMYGFKVTAVNAGGQSFPSEILSVYRSSNNNDEILIVNGFDRISGPEHFNLGTLAGFLNDKDAGVPDQKDISFIGKQYEFSTASVYKSNTNPGFGASERTHEDQIIKGNTFDYPSLHGQSIRGAGYSFVSASSEAIAGGDIQLDHYRVVDYIAGKQKQTLLGNVKKEPAFQTFPLDLQRRIRAYLSKGGNLFVSGAYIASDMYNTNDESRRFIEEVLGVRPVDSKDKQFGMVRFDSPASSGLKLQTNLNYHIYPNQDSYFVEEADILEPVGEQSRIAGWYNGGSHASVVVSQKEGRAVVMGFPFETIIEKEERDRLMQRILLFMVKK